MEEELKRYFTVSEAEALIPRLTEIMGDLMDAHSEVEEVQGVLRSEQRRIMISGGGLLDTQMWRERAGRLDQLTHRVQEGAAAIVSLGGVPKDLGMGLVDFPFLLSGEEINLCWRFGEKKIRFWHGLDEGYAARKPISEE